jgi:hypothetical protein
MRPSDAASWVQRCYWSRQTREEDGIVLLAYGVVKTGFDSLNMGPECSRLSGPALISINAGALVKCIEGCRACASNDQLSHGGFN